MDQPSIAFIEKFRRLSPANQDKVIACLDWTESQYELAPESIPEPLLSGETREPSLG